MWWLRKSAFATCALPACALLCLLAACGFQPMYGDAATGVGKDSPLRGNIAIAPIPLGGHEGQILMGALEDRFDPEGLQYATPDYRLKINLHKTLIPAVVKSDGTIQRYDVLFDSTFSLVRTANGKVLFSGSLRHTGSYNAAVNGNFATYEAGQDMIERTLTELAEDYVLRISGYFASDEFAKEKAKEAKDAAALAAKKQRTGSNIADINARLP
jgi:hypothetical protein